MRAGNGRAGGSHTARGSCRRATARSIRATLPPERASPVGPPNLPLRLIRPARHSVARSWVRGVRGRAAERGMSPTRSARSHTPPPYPAGTSILPWQPQRLAHTVNASASSSASSSHSPDESRQVQMEVKY